MTCPLHPAGSLSAFELIAVIGPRKAQARQARLESEISLSQVIVVGNRRGDEDLRNYMGLV